jgi:hypothetical protein
MPEATVNEDGNAGPAERNIGDASRLREDGNVDAIAKSARMQLPAQR